MLNRKGFTLGELLIVVAITGVLTVISLPVFNGQMEKSREAKDLTNVRNAYAEVLVAAMTEDTTAKYKGETMYKSGTYVASVKLSQQFDGWDTDITGMQVGGVQAGDYTHWQNRPKAGGTAKVYYKDYQVYINRGGEDYINAISASEFLTKDLLISILGSSYGFNVVNSNEPLSQKGGTYKFEEFAKANGVDLKQYGANTWQIYAKGDGQFLDQPVIYWSTVELNNTMDKQFIPIMGYRDGKYDVYRAEIITYNRGTAKEYTTIKNNFVKIGNTSSVATFEYENYYEALDIYNKLMLAYEANGTVTTDDLRIHGIK
ncbi:MAG: type II secretion system protein [Erysipelotrichaceae bacterium]|nr:type II secretion system protein [Erysipelotrichaceae bacterium]